MVSYLGFRVSGVGCRHRFADRGRDAPPLRRDVREPPRLSSALAVQGEGSGFRVQGEGSGFRVQGEGSGFRVQGEGSGFRPQGSEFRVPGSGFRVWGLDSGGCDSGFGVQGFGFDVYGSRFRGEGIKCRVEIWGIVFWAWGLRVGDDKCALRQVELEGLLPLPLPPGIRRAHTLDHRPGKGNF